MSDDIDTIKRLQQQRSHVSVSKLKTSKLAGRTNGQAPLNQALDVSLYDRSDVNKFAGYNTSLAVHDDQMDVDDDAAELNGHRLIGQYTATQEQLNEYAHGDTEEVDMITNREQNMTIASRESDYQKRRFNRMDTEAGATNSQLMALRALEQEEKRVHQLIAEKTAKAAQTNGRKRRARWDDQDDTKVGAAVSDSPAAEPASKRASRWDQVPTFASGSAANASGADGGAAKAAAMAAIDLGPELPYDSYLLTDSELDRLLPGKAEGFTLLPFPPGWVRKSFPQRRAPRPPQAKPIKFGGFMIQEEQPRSHNKELMPSEIPGLGNDLAYFKESDSHHFKKLLDGQNENDLTVEELKERKIMRLLLKVKNGTPPLRKAALRQITDNARHFGASALFNQILPLLMEKTLEDQERHLLVKVVDRILYKLDELVRPFCHRILVVIEPLLIDQDYYARVEGREIISNLSKAAGLAHMISTMRPDIDHVDEYVRNTTARAFAVVATALGIPALLPFLRAVCRSKKSWQARHTGVKIVQQIPILMGCAILPHLKGLVQCIAENLNDEQAKVRTVTALAIAALAEASCPYGIESFDEILNPLWTGARKQRGKGLAAFLKAVGYVVPLMDEEYANYYTGQIMEILLREFASPDDEMKKVVLKVVSQCASTNGVTAAYLKENVLTEFFKNYWVRRMALDKKNSRQVIDTTVDLGQKVGGGELIERMVVNLKDESDSYRKMTAETIEKVTSSLGTADVGERLEELLIDGILHAFQEQASEDMTLLNCFGTVVNSLGTRCKRYLLQITTTILRKLDSKVNIVRQHAADLVARIAVVLKKCEEDAMLAKVGVVLFECLGEEYPEVLGSIIGALRAIVTVVGVHDMQPPVKDLLPRLTPILRNRHEKVQENTIDLVGRIADRGPESVVTREWMRICFELLDMLKAHKKGIRRAANNTFGYIAKAIGPQDVLVTLMNNLRVQERQSRVCTAVAIGIVAETCAPFTVLPALMNEYRVPELNVQNGILKALTFLFEYIGEMAKDYVYAVTPLLEDALIDRDQVHRQTAASVVKHIALGVVGLGCEDALQHLLNLLIPNIYETSPHVIDRICEAIDAVRLAVGNGILLNYVLAGLFHPARKVRMPYWRLYNDAYVNGADSMVPYYPNLPQVGIVRHELYIML